MKKIKYISSYLPEMNEANGRNIEKMVGCVQVPLGLAGPIKIDGKNYQIPVATTEGALVASLNRGCKVIRESEEFEVRVEEVGVTRGPVFRVKGVKEGEKLIDWVEKNVERFEKVAVKTERHLRLLGVEHKMVGRNVWLRFRFKSDEAMGMNMATTATEKLVNLIKKEMGVECVSLSGNYCVDKKPSWLNMIEGRGKRVWAEAVISRKTIGTILKTTAEKIVEVVYRKQLLGSIMSGSMGFNAHYANIVAGVFLATGQDIAHTVEGSMGVTTAEILPSSDDLYFSVYLPSLMTGTVGGGTHLATQKEALLIMGLGKGKKGEVIEFSKVIGGAVLAGELSLTAALASKDLVKAHQNFGRGI